MIKEDINYKLFGNVAEDKGFGYSPEYTLRHVVEVRYSIFHAYNIMRVTERFNNIMKHNNLKISIDEDGYIYFDSEATRTIFYLKFV